MTINRANQTWPEDVTTNLFPQAFDELFPGRLGNPAVGTDGLNRPQFEQVKQRAMEMESEMEFERRQRGSASTIAALFIITLFVVCAVAVWPVLSALANVAK